MRRVTNDGVRVHDSFRHHGGSRGAQCVLVVGHTEIDKNKGYADDLFHLDARSARELRDALNEFLNLPGIEQTYPVPRSTEGDRQTYEAVSPLHPESA